MRRVLLAAGCLGVLATGLVIWRLSCSACAPGRGASGPHAAGAEPSAVTPGKPAPGSQRQSRLAQPRLAPAADRTEPAQAGSVTNAASPQPAEEQARAKAVAAWERMIDEVSEQDEAPATEQSARLRQAFHKLAKEDRVDGLNLAINILQDERFAVLYAIFFDKAEDPEVLDAIFDDALNRDETIKVPLMKALYQYKEHPLYAEAARILDATGELENMTDEPAATGEPAAE